MRAGPFAAISGMIVMTFLAAESPAQQTTITSPFRTLNEGFFERNGVSWGGNYRGVNFSFGNANLANPAFGGFQPGAGLNTNFGIAGKHGQANFSLDFSQGFRRSLTTQAPSVTVMNGQTGYFSDTSQTPFVISQVPVVGAFPMIGQMTPYPPQMFSVPGLGAGPPPVNPRVQAMRQARADAVRAENNPDAPPLMQPAPHAGQPKPNLKAMHVPPEPVPAPQAGGVGKLAAAQASSAGRAAPSVAEARRLHEQEKAAADGDLHALMERAQAAEEDGKPGVAKIYYQMLIKRADGDLKIQAQQRLDAIHGTANP